MILDLSEDEEEDLYVVLDDNEEPLYFEGAEVFPSEIKNYMGCDNYCIRTSGVTVRRKTKDGLICDILIDQYRNITEITIMESESK